MQEWKLWAPGYTWLVSICRVLSSGMSNNNKKEWQRNISNTIICIAVISILETTLTYKMWLSSIQCWQNFTEDSCFTSVMNLALYRSVSLHTINSPHFFGLLSLAWILRWWLQKNNWGQVLSPKEVFINFCNQCLDQWVPPSVCAHCLLGSCVSVCTIRYFKAGTLRHYFQFCRCKRNIELYCLLTNTRSTPASLLTAGTLLPEGSDSHFL